MMEALQWLGVLGWALTAFILIRILLAIRDSLALAVLSVAAFAVPFFIARDLLANSGWPATHSLVGGLYAGSFVSLLVPKKRSRHIPAKVRRRVIARDLKGEKYDPAKHHVDHIWPYARGGGHTPDNLRVIEKEKNLRKGRKPPGLLDWL
jgi:hypothetical protein